VKQPSLDIYAWRSFYLPQRASAWILQKKVKVFILAGQSNMEGKAKVELLEYQINQPEPRDNRLELR